MNTDIHIYIHTYIHNDAPPTSVFLLMLTANMTTMFMSKKRVSLIVIHAPTSLLFLQELRVKLTATSVMSGEMVTPIIVHEPLLLVNVTNQDDTIFVSEKME